MVGREKILTWLEICGKNRDCSGTCPYSGLLCGEDDDSKCREDLMADALDLLKEQEEQIERLEHDLDVAQNDLHYYVNGND